MDNKVEYLHHLELPFFIGAVNQNLAEMRVYSAEFLPILFSEVGKPTELSLYPVDGSKFDPTSYYDRTGEGAYRMRCPLIATFGVTDNPAVMKPKVDALLEICARTQGNIASKTSEEHIYDVDGKGQWKILAGTGSFVHFRDNFVLLPSKTGHLI